MKEHVTKHPLYGVWRRMIQRCESPTCSDYRYYGARGITVCDRWHDFKAFLLDVGDRPEGATLDRIDNNRGYSPDNVRWASRQAQMQNTRAVRLITYQGETMTISAWERKLGWKPGTLKARITRLGYSVEDAFTKDIKPGVVLPGRPYPKKEQHYTQMRGVSKPKPGMFSPQQAGEIRSEVASGVSRSEVARRLNVSVQTVCNIVNRKGNYA